MKERYVIQTAEQWYGDELTLYADRYMAERNHYKVKNDFLELNILNERTLEAAARRIGRISRRAIALGDEGLELLAQANTNDKAALILMSYLEVYRLPYEFVFEWLVTRMDRIDRPVFIGEFDQFYQHKHTQEPELLSWSDSSIRRIRTQIFTMLQKGNLIKKVSPGSFQVYQLLLSDKTTAYFERRTPYHLTI
ncbi:MULTISPECIES: BrxA family protein [Saccharibacillus]|uniref:BrxA family protein n=1 Tax=Saccharibacillus TaxID=456492 RepID=UPI00123958AD|nr:BrxA family protein [Saccharibacillus sp. WB 17]MWJ31312.1 DUF1819 family protein [Saccharibacillus sp. WB 17]